MIIAIYCNSFSFILHFFIIYLHQIFFPMKFCTIFIWLLAFQLNAQQIQFNDNYEPIQVSFDEEGVASIAYTVNKDHSLYMASQIYHTSVDDILQYNNIEDAKYIELNRSVRIPLKQKYVYKGVNLNSFEHTKFIPLQYTVKKKENLYRIAKVYCDESIEAMKLRNGLIDNNLDIGQKLIIGWIPVSKNQLFKISEPESLKKESQINTNDNHEFTSNSNELMRREEASNINDVTLEDSLAIDSLARPLKIERGIAIWKKSSKGHSKYALHPTAKLNSEIELYNPLVNRTVKAKVIGRIPVGTYSNDVSVIISPATAVSLGALDHRFSVKMTYEEDL